MDVKNFFDSFKDFFWDIIGYFLPGLYLLLLLSSCVLPERFYYTEILKSNSDLYVFIFVVLSYILGYLVYGVGVLKDKLFGSYSSSQKIEKKTQETAEFKLSKELMKNYITEHQLTTTIDDDIKTRSLRNLVMPFVPEVDNKTYTFMFRSDLCKHIGNISLLIGILGYLNKLVDWFWGSLPVFKVDSAYLILYSILILSYFLFRATRNYFYSIAIKIPFSAYITIREKRSKRSVDE
jgi:hypothetical protein